MSLPVVRIDTWSPAAADLLAEHVGDGWALESTPLPFVVDGLYLHPKLDVETRAHLVARYPALTVHDDVRAPRDGAAIRLQALATGPRLRLRNVTFGSVRRARRVLDAMADVAKKATPETLCFKADVGGLLRYGLASAEQRVAIAALLGLELDVSLQVERPWSPSDADIDLGIPRPSGTDRVREASVVIEVDAPSPEAHTLAETLRARGLPNVEVAVRVGLDRFTLWPGALAAASPLEGTGPLTNAVTDLLTTLGVDTTRTPLETWKPDYDEPFVESITRIQLPLARWSSGILHPYVEGRCDSYAVTLRTNKAAACAPLMASLTAAGFRVSLSDLVDTVIAPTLTMQRLARDTGPLTALQLALKEAGHAMPVQSGAHLREREVELQLPIGLSEAEIDDRITRACAGYNVVLRGSASARRELKRASKKLEAAGFSRVRIRSRSTSPGAAGCLTYGAAPAHVLDRIEQALGVSTGTWERNQRFAHRDHDVYVELPQAAQDDDETPAPQETAPFAAWLCEPAATQTTRVFVEACDDGARVGAHSLPTGPAPRDAEDAAPDWVIDASTAATLHVLTRAVRDRVPALLEGPTATSKSSAIVWLARTLGFPVVRVNLSAHADTAELLGRYVPTSGGWRWCDGSVVQALRTGAWLLLDEVNLADPAVIERLNPLLEDAPTLRLTEHDGETFGRDGTPIHPDFRVFATANPSTYGGRKPMSPALRDRFILHHHPAVPSEDDLMAMLLSLTLGKSTPITVAEQRYHTTAATLRYPLGLDSALGPQLLRQLARLWSGLIRLGDQPDVFGLGSAPVYTRRGLIALTRGLSRGMQAGRPLDRVLREELLAHVVGRAGRHEDRVAIARLLDASGLGPTTWSPCHGAGPTQSDLFSDSVDAILGGV